MDLGKPIGANHTVPTGGFDQGEHGAGIGLSGGHGQVNSHNTQAGIAAAEQGHSHHHHHHQHGTGASTGGIPSGTPIADKFTSQGQGQNSVAGAYAGGATDDGLTGQSNAHRTGAGVGYNGENLPTSSASAAGGAGLGSHSHSTGVSDNTVSGAYAGGGTRDALAGESHAQRTGAGVGPLGENLGHSGHSHATDAALASTATGAAVGAGAIAGSQSGTGVGVGPSGGAGGHYATESTGTGNNLTTGYGTGTGNDSGVGAGGLASGTGASGAGVLDAQRAGAQAHREGHGLSSGTAAGVGAGALGAGAVGAGSSGLGKGDTSTSVPSADNERGAPIVDPKELDHGGRHGLIFDQATGKYVHRHEVEEGK